MDVPRERNAGAATAPIRIVLIHNGMDPDARAMRIRGGTAVICNGCSLQKSLELGGWRKIDGPHAGFLDPAYLTQRYHSTYVGDLLYGVPDLMVVAPHCVNRGRRSAATGCAGRLAPRKPVSTRGWGCFTTLLNGRPPEMGSFNPEWEHNEIDFWYRPRDIVGVEVYHVPSQIPRDLRRYSEPHCGIINYWTRNKW